MKKFRFYLLVTIVTFLVLFLFYFLGDFSNRVRLIYSIFREEDKNKILSDILQKAQPESMKPKLDSALKTFAMKIENNSYTDEQLRNLLEEFDRISNLEKLDSLTIEMFNQKVNRGF